MQTSAWLILLFPLAGTVVNGLGYRVLPGKAVGWIGTAAILGAFVAAIATFVALQDRGEEHRQVVYVAWDYANTVGVDGKLSILVDPLSVFMALVVSGVSMLIHLYSVAYLFSDRGYARFFAYLNYFVLSMLILVMAGNFLVLIIGWAFVGAASYMLISFWYRRTTATAAGIKAFVVNVVGDVGLVLGTYFIFRHSGTLDFLGTFGLAVTDVKRVIAYSTMSQIGYMIMGVSAGAYVAGLFHLMTHAFFKALLFMAAGSVIAAMAGAQDIDRMGGLRRALPFTSTLMIVGALALAAFPGTSGFFSKDEILVFAATRGSFYWIFTIAGYLAAMLTALYAFRIIFRVFWGEPVPEAHELERGELAHAEPRNPISGEEEDTDVGFPGPEHHIAERERPMWWAMAILGFLSIFGGFVQLPEVTNVVENFLASTFADSRFESIVPSGGSAYVGLLAGALLSLAGVALAYYVYVARPGTSGALARRFAPVHALLVNKWYFDELYDALVYRPAIATGRVANSIVERVVVQGLVTAVVDGVHGVGVIVRGAQSGFVRAYALLLVGGFAALGLYFLIVS